MSRTAALLAISAALLTAACGTAAAQQQVQLPDSGPLAIPAAPSHIVVPAAPEPPPVPSVDTPSAQITLPASGSGAMRPQITPPPRAVAPPTPPSTPQTAAPAAPAPLPAAPNQGELEQQARALVLSADQTLDKIDYKALGTDGRAQYDTAKRFLKQADDALKARNIVYAWQLANKANTIATLLK